MTLPASNIVLWQQFNPRHMEMRWATNAGTPVRSQERLVRAGEGWSREAR